MKQIGLVLSGGMGKGAYQVGALKALNEFFHPSDFQYVSAASVGALNTYTYLTNNLEKALQIWQSVNLKGNKRFITSVLQSSYLQDIVTDIISDVPISGSFYVPLLNLSEKELDYYNFADIPVKQIDNYLRASIAMPFYNKGIKVDGQVLYDGAVVDNIPVYPVLKNELDYVICIYFDDFNYIFEDNDLNNKIIKLTFPDNKIISNSVCISHDAIMYMIEEGYRRTKVLLAEIFTNGTEDLAAIYGEIAKRNEKCSRKMVRITGDVIVTNMNKIVQRVVRNKKILEGGVLYGK